MVTDTIAAARLAGASFASFAAAAAAAFTDVWQAFERAQRALIKMRRVIHRLRRDGRPTPYNGALSAKAYRYLRYERRKLRQRGRHVGPEERAAMLSRVCERGL